METEQAGGSQDRLRLRSDQLEWREVEGEIVVLDLRTSRYLSLNETGGVLWSALLDGVTREDLVARLVDSYGIDEQTAGEDVDAFLASLSEQQLLE